MCIHAPGRVVSDRLIRDVILIYTAPNNLQKEKKHKERKRKESKKHYKKKDKVRACVRSGVLCASKRPRLCTFGFL